MKIIDFSKLYELDYNLNSLFAMRQFWKEGTLFRMTAPRKTSCLLYFSGGSGKYKFQNGEELIVSRGSIIYIPQGLQYESMFFDCDDTLPATILIEFNLIQPDGEHFKLSNKLHILKESSSVVLFDLFNEAVELYSSAVISISAIKSVVYKLLSDLSHTERQQNIYSRGFYTIAKGIAHLENEIKSKKTIKEIADMCHVSQSTFRRLFKQYTGKSPTEYRNDTRIIYAKNLLDTGSMTTTEVAAELGFDDPAYFCRVFKKRTGITPGEYCKNVL